MTRPWRGLCTWWLAPWTAGWLRVLNFMKAMKSMEEMHKRAGLTGAFPGPRAAMGAALLTQQMRCLAQWQAGETGAALAAAGGSLRQVAAMALRSGM